MHAGGAPHDDSDVDGGAQRENGGHARGAPQDGDDANDRAQCHNGEPALILPPTAAMPTAAHSALVAGRPAACRTVAGMRRSDPKRRRRQWRRAARPRRAGSDAPDGSDDADGHVQGLGARYANVPLGGHTANSGGHRLGGRVPAGCAPRPGDRNADPSQDGRDADPPHGGYSAHGGARSRGDLTGSLQNHRRHAGGGAERLGGRHSD